MVGSCLRLLFILAACWSFRAAGQQPASWVGKLPQEIQESSGLLLLGDRFVTHNDSGNPPVLFELDTTDLQIVRRVRVMGVANTDWEALAEDGEYLYVGDIGNNQGMRRDLKILRISKKAFRESHSVVPEVIFFSYETQKEFVMVKNSDYDAEAMVVGQDSIWIFTKQWQQKGTDVYSLSKTPGEHIARRVASYSPGGLVTDASPLTEGEGVLLLGYTPQLQPFIFKIPDLSTSDILPGDPRKTLLSIGFAQSEGLVATPDGSLFISAEAISNRWVSLPAGVYRLDLRTEMEQASGKTSGESPH